MVKKAAKRLQKGCKKTAERLQKGCCCLWAAADVIRRLDATEMHSSIVHQAKSGQELKFLHQLITPFPQQKVHSTLCNISPQIAAANFVKLFKQIAIRAITHNYNLKHNDVDRSSRSRKMLLVQYYRTFLKFAFQSWCFFSPSSNTSF